MNITTALNRMKDWDNKGKYVFLTKDLATIFYEDSPKTLMESLARLTKSGIFERVCKGVYLFTYTKHKDANIIEIIAKTLRRGFYNYISLESALSELGAISQILMDRLTVMTTGRKGEYSTPYGVIEFTHTQRDEIELLKQIYTTDRPLKVAKLETAIRDLKRVGRNTHLLDWGVINIEMSNENGLKQFKTENFRAEKVKTEKVKNNG
jgi:predicted transcriptional regulator of viral defense system